MLLYIRIYIQIVMYKRKTNEEPLASPSLGEYGDNAKEEWRPVVINGEKTIYIVSNFGRVVIAERGRGIMFGSEKAQYNSQSGYKMVTIRHNGRTFPTRVHRLVAEAFVPNELGLPFVNHKDENRANNRADNLEWCNNTYNVNYGTIKDRAGAPFRKKVCQYSYDGKLVKVWDSLASIGKEKEYTWECVSNCARGIKKTHKGYFWLFLDDEQRDKKLSDLIEWINIGGNSRHTKKVPVCAYDSNGNLIRRFASQKEAEAIGASQRSVSSAIRSGRRHIGYYWRRG